jgi:EAL domain-containing protein (putative c-di-GMP-specific phosphodiesterase class I)
MRDGTEPATERLSRLTSAPTTDLPVLLVDDDEMIVRALGRALRNAGYLVETETNALAASARLAKERFRAVVSDVNMPRATGVDLLTVARAYDADTPFVLVTGAAGPPASLEEATLATVVVLLKPVSIVALVEAVRAAIARREDAIAANAGGGLAAVSRAEETLHLVFQPIVGAGDDAAAFRGGDSSPGARPRGYEAFLRTGHLGFPSPLDFLDAAEELGRLAAVGERLRSLASSAMSDLPDACALFLNLHPRELLHDSLYDARAPLSLAAHRVVLEITEREDSTPLADLERRLGELRSMGFRIGIDDVGSGRAPLTSFAPLKPDYVKLDMTLVRSVDTSAVHQRAVRSVVEVAMDLGIAVVAEGVETSAEWACLAQLHVDLFQGYLFGRPAPSFM